MEKKRLFNRALSWLLDYFSVIKEGIKNIGSDNISILSSGMVYSTLLALVPCVTFLASFLSGLGVFEPFWNTLAEWLNGTFGYRNGDYILSLLSTFTNNALSLGVVGLVSFLITGIFLVNKVYNVINNIFRTKPTTSTLTRYALFLVFLVVFTVLIAFVFALSSKLGAQVSEIIGISKEVQSIGVSVLKRSGSILALFVAFFLLLYVVPAAKIKTSAALSGATLGTVAFTLFQSAFSYFISLMVKTSVIYGSIASILFVFLFLYVIWYLIIIICEITYIYQFRPNRNTSLGHPITSERQLGEAIDVLLYISNNFKEGKGGATVREIAKATNIPTSRVISYLSDFSEAHLVLPLNVQKSCYVLGRPSQRIKAAEIFSSIFSANDQTSSLSKGEEYALSFKEAGLEKFKDKTLADLENNK